MERLAVLTELDRRMLEAFSLRTTEKLRAALPLRIALPHLESFLPGCEISRAAQRHEHVSAAFSGLTVSV